MRPWRIGPTRSVQASLPFSVQFPSNTDDLTDIAIPLPYRLENRARFEDRDRSEMSNHGELMYINQNFTSLHDRQHPSQFFKTNHRSYVKSQEESIYEDILAQEKQSLLSRNIIPSYEDFDDPWVARHVPRALPLPPRHSKNEEMGTSKSIPGTNGLFSRNGLKYCRFTVLFPETNF
ncbi:unnamed protein product [Strongylus vulgaris]|uniref:Uncharacterized protein n=1 Tax=Strongylus vulgaris TaxID=40348 RepID=A0A3P7KPT3_STRVU|nr:unnamed protein product [Strongylus vulgaris]